jgi:hypothetical protein
MRGLERSNLFGSVFATVFARAEFTLETFSVFEFFFEN